MNYLSAAYFSFFLCYIIELSCYILYFRIYVRRYRLDGIRIQPLRIFKIYDYVLISFLSFIAISTVYFSKRQNMLIPFIILQANIILNSCLNLPYGSEAYYSLPFFFFSTLGFCLVLYFYKPIYNITRDYEFNKLNLTENQKTKINVSKI